MTFGELTANHLGQTMRVHGGHRITIGGIHHELYHGKPRTVVTDVGGLRRWIYISDRECKVLL